MLGNEVDAKLKEAVIRMNSRWETGHIREITTQREEDPGKTTSRKEDDPEKFRIRKLGAGGWTDRPASKGSWATLLSRGPM
jgi:hypothetical protein